MLGSKYIRKKELAIAALLANRTISEAAVAAGVAEITLLRWLQNEEFKEAYSEARQEIVSRAISALQGACCVAVSTLIDVMQNSGKDSPRVSAAKSVLELSLHAIEIEELEQKLNSLESQLQKGHI